MHSQDCLRDQLNKVMGEYGLTISDISEYTSVSPYKLEKFIAYDMSCELSIYEIMAISNFCHNKGWC